MTSPARDRVGSPINPPLLRRPCELACHRSLDEFHAGLIDRLDALVDEFRELEARLADPETAQPTRPCSAQRRSGTTSSSRSSPHGRSASAPARPRPRPRAARQRHRRTSASTLRTRSTRRRPTSNASSTSCASCCCRVIRTPGVRSSSRSEAPRAARRPTCSPATSTTCTRVRRQPPVEGRDAVARRQRPGRHQPGHVRGPRRRCVAAPQVRGRTAPGAARAGHREPGPGAHVVGDGGGAAGGRRGRGDDRRPRPRIDVYRSVGRRRPARQHDRLGGPDHPRAIRASWSRCRTSAASCRTGPGRCRCCGPACTSGRARADAELSAERRSQVGGGGRSEKIRTYNYKENRVTDHRIGFTVYRLSDVLAGDLDLVVDPLLHDERARQLADVET